MEIQECKRVFQSSFRGLKEIPVGLMVFHGGSREWEGAFSRFWFILRDTRDVLMNFDLYVTP